MCTENTHSRCKSEGIQGLSEKFILVYLFLREICLIFIARRMLIFSWYISQSRREMLNWPKPVNSRSLNYIFLTHEAEQSFRPCPHECVFIWKRHAFSPSVPHTKTMKTPLKTEDFENDSQSGGFPKRMRFQMKTHSVDGENEGFLKRWFDLHISYIYTVLHQSKTCHHRQPRLWIMINRRGKITFLSLLIA